MVAVAGLLSGRSRGTDRGEGRVLGGVAAAAGWLAGRVLAAAPGVPGVAGAAAVSVGAGFFVSHVWGHGLAPWVGLTVGGVFALLLDRRL